MFSKCHTEAGAHIQMEVYVFMCICVYVGIFIKVYVHMMNLCAYVHGGCGMDAREAIHSQ